MSHKIILFFALLYSANLGAQVAKSTPEYDVVVSFGSMCCGTASDDFLKDFITKFNTKNKVAVSSWQLVGCGREGESKILFSLAEIKKSTKKKFIKEIKQLVPQQNKKNKAIKSSSGNISLEYDLAAGSFTNCRGQITKWKSISKK